CCSRSATSPGPGGRRGRSAGASTTTPTSAGHWPACCSSRSRTPRRSPPCRRSCPAGPERGLYFPGHESEEHDMRRLVITAVLAVAATRPLAALELGNYELVDLSHAYGEDTLYWPTSPSDFRKQELAFGETEGGWFYSAYSICTPEHGGT